MTTITIDGVEYDSEKMSDVTKTNISTIRYIDNELARLSFQTATLQTARSAYANAIKQELGVENEADGGELSLEGMSENISFD
jgi:hypothetical protein